MDDRTRLAQTAHAFGVDIAPDILLAIVHTAFAPHDTMSAQERRFLLASGAPPDSFDQRRQAEARARLAARAADTAARASARLTTREVAAQLGVSASTVRRLARSGDLYAIVGGRGRTLLFPAWQLVEHKPLGGLRRVLALLPASSHPLSVEGFMTSPQEELDHRSPVEWLAAGQPIAVVETLADSYARS